MAAKEEVAKVRRPQAQKRDIQNEKRNLRNRVFKSQIHTAKRHFTESLTSGDQTSIQQKLKEVYSLLDKGVKQGVVKLNTAARTKQRFTVKAQAKSA